MLIDWVSFKYPLIEFSRDQVEYLRTTSDHIIRYCPRTGDIKYETSAWESIKSDSHQVSFHVGSTHLKIQGSPGRAIGDGDAVFGSDPCSTLSIFGCIMAMSKHVSKVLDILLPKNPLLYEVTRVDVTSNLLLHSLTDVKSALTILRNCEGGRYRVSQQCGDTVYWSHSSTLRSGKAYAKGPQLNKLMKKKNYTGRGYSIQEIELADRLLRLELKLGCEFFRRNDWRCMIPEYLNNQWESYFMRMIGDSRLKTDDDVRIRIFETAKREGKTPGAARAAYLCWSAIKNEGWEQARELYNKRTWYRHKKLLSNTGLGDADISVGRVVGLKIVEAEHISSWEQLRNQVA
jgi:II/X family phage/plasmid replication protein